MERLNVVGNRLHQKEHKPPLRRGQIEGQQQEGTVSQSSSFYAQRGKRLLDAFFSLLGLVALSPLLGLIGVTVKCGSPGGALFWQERIGRDEKIFRICKFRTMVAGADRMGPGITAAGDPRITRIGALLRRWKLDELPQLWNVLKGEMSLVGPRPEMPLYVRTYTLTQRKVLSVMPGITDAASIVCRDEEEILEKAADREQFYKQVVLPHKLALNLEYIHNLSFRHDIAIILRTLKVISSHPMPPAKISETPPKATPNSNSQILQGLPADGAEHDHVIRGNGHE